MTKKLVIEAGHGLYTAGKRIPKALDPNETREWTLNNRIVVKTIKILEEYEGLQILRTDDPTGKIDVPLSERTTLANNFKADLFISVHANAYLGKPWSGGGTTVYVHPNAPANTKRLQKDLYNELIKQTGLKGNRATGTPTGNFHVVRETKMPSVLSENGFMDSRIDSKIILTEKFADQTARAHANFVINEFKLRKKEVITPTPPTKTDELYRVQVGAYRVKRNADVMEKKLKQDGFATYMIKTTSGLYRVQTGAFAVKSNAIALERKLKGLGYDTFLTTNAVNDAAKDEPKVIEPKPTPPAVVKVGSKVQVRRGAKSYTGGGLAAFIYNNIYTVDHLTGDRAVLDTKGINTPINVKDLILK